MVEPARTTEHGTSTSDWEERTAADLSSLLVELGRLTRAAAFYETDDESRRDIVDRAVQAWRADLERAGPLELWVEAWGFSSPGIRESIGHDPFGDLAHRMLALGVERVTFEPELTRGSLQAFGELLGAEPDAVLRNGGFAAALFTRTRPGIAVNGQRWIGRSGQPEHTETESAPADETSAEELVSASQRSPAGSASLGSALLGSRSVIGMHPDERKPDLQDEPLHSEAGHGPSSSLARQLRELDACVDDDAYAELVGRIAQRAGDLAGDGYADEAYRAALVLADHAGGRSGRSIVQARAAQRVLIGLAEDPTVLTDLIDRTRAPGSAAVRASQVLLQVGQPAVAPILDRLEAEKDADRAAQLSAIVITLGECAVDTLLERIESGPGARTMLALQLAGQMQNPRFMPVLEQRLADSWPALRREAAKALVHVGDAPAVRALVGALESSLGGLPEIAAYCLGALGDRRAVRPLGEALSCAVSRSRWKLAHECVRALGRLRAAEASSILAGVLERRSLFRRRALHGLQREVIATLEGIPGSAARRVLARAARAPDDTLRERAQQALADRDSTRAADSSESSLGTE